MLTTLATPVKSVDGDISFVCVDVCLTVAIVGMDNIGHS